MLTALDDLRRWWHHRRGQQRSASRALAGKWPDTAQWMARLSIHARDAGSFGRTGAPLAAAPKYDADRGR
jgi:hypothetical protein